MACFAQSDDPVFLHRLLEEIAPRARRIVAQFVKRGGEDAIPPPSNVQPSSAADAAGEAEAEATVRALNDFSLLQAAARVIGQRVEALEIVASAGFPEGTAVAVPKTPAFPPKGPYERGTVTATGTSLRVTLDNGGMWQGPPSLARLAASDDEAAPTL